MTRAAPVSPGHLFEPALVPTEKQYQKAITDALTKGGYRWSFVHRMFQPQSGRWLTGTSSPGFPDLLALRPGYVLAIEVKSRTGRPTPAQLEWLAAFHDAGALAWVVSPKDDLAALARWIARPSCAPDRHGW